MYSPLAFLIETCRDSPWLCLFQFNLDLDFASVQRDNPEMERRAQAVINACTSLGEKNPLISIHDVGAGGLSNALPELVHDR